MFHNFVRLTMDNFVAIDVETANYNPESICSIGAVKVIDGVIADSFYELVKPEPEYYIGYFTRDIHGIGMADTEDADTFDKVWSRVAQFIGNLPLVDQKKSFDEK